MSCVSGTLLEIKRQQHLRTSTFRRLRPMMPVMAKRGPKSPMTDEHKAALARGRSEGRAVRDYLESLRANKPRRGRRRTKDSIAKRLAAIETELASTDALGELKLLQERRDLQAELESKSAVNDHAGLEDAFVKVARSYSERQGITYTTWREIGVDAAVLSKAGIVRRG
jgi:hypothetical protein